MILEQQIYHIDCYYYKYLIECVCSVYLWKNTCDKWIVINPQLSYKVRCEDHHHINMMSTSPSSGQLCGQMKHPNSGTECFEFNLSKALNLRCVHSRFTVCGGCESCVLATRITCMKTWFSKAGDRSRRRFTLGLIRRLHSSELICHVVQLLQPMLYKDVTYARTRTKPSLRTDQATTSDDRALSLVTLEKDITDTWYWFETTNYWTKCNFLLAIMQDCEAHLLHAIGTLAKTLVASEYCAATPRSGEHSVLSEFVSIRTILKWGMHW